MSRSFETGQRVARVLRCLREKRWEEAERETEEGLVREPESAALLALAAELHRKRKKLPEAESFLRRAEASDPSEELVLSVGADLAFDLGDYRRAALRYRQALDQKPSSYGVSRLVQALHRLRQFDKAAEAARQGLERYPDDPWLLRGLTAAVAKQGRREEAVALYEKLVALDPKDRFAYKELMRLRTADSPAGEAAAALKGLLKSGDRAKNPHLRTLAADRIRDAGHLAEAAAEYEAALSLDPGNRYTLSQLGFCYRRLGETTKAIETLGRAFLAEPGSPQVRKSLESLCRQTGNLARLAALVDEALGLHPEIKSLHGVRKRIARLASEGAGQAKNHESGSP